jgi:predicted nucleotidyltransferase
MATDPIASHLSAQALGDLRTAVQTSRDAVEGLRSEPHAQHELARARSILLAAMQAFAEGLRINNLPVPPRFRDELRLYADLERLGRSDGRYP